MNLFNIIKINFTKRTITNNNININKEIPKCIDCVNFINHIENGIEYHNLGYQQLVKNRIKVYNSL